MARWPLCGCQAIIRLLTNRVIQGVCAKSDPELQGLAKTKHSIRPTGVHVFSVKSLVCFVNVSVALTFFFCVFFFTQIQFKSMMNLYYSISKKEMLSIKGPTTLATVYMTIYKTV